MADKYIEDEICSDSYILAMMYNDAVLSSDYDSAINTKALSVGVLLVAVLWVII